MEIQTTIKEFPQRIKNLNVSPETSIRVIIDKFKDQGQKGKWAKVAGKISAESPLKGYGEDLKKASQEFRSNFRFRKLPDFTHIEDE